MIRYFNQTGRGCARGSAYFQGYSLACRSERSEESPNSLSLQAQTIGDSSLSSVIQNDIMPAMNNYKWAAR